MSLTGKDIAEIARLLDDSPFASLDLQQGDFRLRIRRDGGGGRDWSEDDEDEDEDEQERVPAQPGTSRSKAPLQDAEGGPRLRGDSQGVLAPAAGEIDIPAPLLGNFYASPRPGEEPFVKVGDTIGEDTIVGIIEVMKLMNSVRAGVAGIVTAVLAESGSAVEQGQPLFRVKAA